MECHRGRDRTRRQAGAIDIHREDTAMNRTQQIAGCAIGLLLVSACSSGGTGSSAYHTPSASNSSAAATPVAATGPVGIATAPNSAGTILTDTKGRAVYLFEADTGSTSTCTGGCATEWPPLTTPGPPVAGTGVNAALLATSPRPDGTTQVTYNGHPLYYYDDDHGPGTTEGQGENSYGAKWYLLTPAGLKIDKD
jgi:predicted lipoprotein with Yx(FWY)xxD motif